MHSINTQYKLHFSRVVCPNKMLKDCKTLTWEILKYIKVSQNWQTCREGCPLPIWTKSFIFGNFFCVVCLTSTYRKWRSGLLARHCVWWFSVVWGGYLSWWCSVRSKRNNKLKCCRNVHADICFTSVTSPVGVQKAPHLWRLLVRKGRAMEPEGGHGFSVRLILDQIFSWVTEASPPPIPTPPRHFWDQSLNFLQTFSWLVLVCVQ